MARAVLEMPRCLRVGSNDLGRDGMEMLREAQRE